MAVAYFLYRSGNRMVYRYIIRDTLGGGISPFSGEAVGWSPQTPTEVLKGMLWWPCRL